MRRPQRNVAPPPAPVVRLRPPPAPPHLEAEEQAFWDSVTREYTVDGDVALRMLQIACNALAQERRCNAQIAADGVQVPDRRGLPRAHPLLKEANQARASFLQALRALRLDIGDDR